MVDWFRVILSIISGFKLTGSEHAGWTSNYLKREAQNGRQLTFDFVDFAEISLQPVFTQIGLEGNSRKK